MAVRRQLGRHGDRTAFALAGDTEHGGGDALARPAARELGRLATDASLDGPLPVIVMGDFNAGPEAADFATLTTVLTDCVAIAADADPDARTLSSDNPFAPLEAALQIDRRIDHLLARPGAPDQRLSVPWSRIVRDRPGGMPPSDHYLVAAELRWG